MLYPLSYEGGKGCHVSVRPDGPNGDGTNGDGARSDGASSDSASSDGDSSRCRLDRLYA